MTGVIKKECWLFTHKERKEVREKEKTKGYEVMQEGIRQDEKWKGERSNGGGGER